MPEMQLMLTQAFKATDFSYADVEGVIANSRWEEELLLPCMVSVQQAPAQPPQAGMHASLTPSANRDQQTARGPKWLQGEAGPAWPSLMPGSQSSAWAPRWPRCGSQSSKLLPRSLVWGGQRTPLGPSTPPPQQPPRCLSPALYQLLGPEPGTEPGLGTRPD